ncbi:unnamed protein product [Cylindrotheca closterium]|uniref:Fe2OG dioxygenase domain-containing protein n=1 Tax=Cylindrotheca closterium TaxID=2856 RepID=A0AAD2CTA7_9STRA|nr:unnamed protein product [Cylindrotheca closterium]
MKSNSIPLLDIALYHSNRSAFVEELRKACHNVGFFLLKHNMTPNQLPKEVLDEGRQFFQRPMDEKKMISYEQNPAFRGYMPLGVENTAGQLDHREQIEYAVEYPLHAPESSATNNFYTKAWPAYHRLKSAPNPWPTSFQPSLQTKTMDYVQNVCQVADCLRDSLCLAMGLDPKVLQHKFNSSSLSDEISNDCYREGEVPHWAIKMISYPTNDHSSKNESSNDRSRSPSPIQGVGAHTDTNFLTLVLQDNEEGDGGLQVFSQGEWINVPTHHGTNVLICNLGEQAETWSRGYFLATPHRVLMKSRTRKPRISLPLFYNPCLSATMEPLEESSVEHLQWDRPIIVHSTDENNAIGNAPKKHWRRPNNTMLTSVGENTFKSLARSHPHVFAKHHPDLSILPDGKIVKK